MSKDIVGQVVAYEAGELTEEEAIEFFQQIVDNGLVWTLQGSYGRTAQRLIDAGLVKVKQEENENEDQE